MLHAPYLLMVVWRRRLTTIGHFYLFFLGMTLNGPLPSYGLNSTTSLQLPMDRRMEPQKVGLIRELQSLCLVKLYYVLYCIINMFKTFYLQM